VPPATFGDLMACAARGSRWSLGPAAETALALWLAANNKVEVDLPRGRFSSGFAKDRPGANYFNVYAGAQYLNAVLNRSLSDRNAAVALKVIKSLGQIIGPSSQGDRQQMPVSSHSRRRCSIRIAWCDTKRRLRWPADSPLSPFPGAERGCATFWPKRSRRPAPAICFWWHPRRAILTKMAGDLKQYGTAGGENAQQAVANAAMLPWVDVVVMTERPGE